MDIGLDRYDELVHAIYEAALQPGRWPGVLQAMTAAFDASSSLLFTSMHSPAQGGFAFAHNIPPFNLERWGAKNIRDDLFRDRAIQRGLFVNGASLNSDELVPRAEVYASRFYRELWEPAGISHGCMGVVFDGSDAHHLPTGASIYRGPQDAPFTVVHTDLLRRLLRHLSRSLGVMYHLRDRQLQVAATLAALDQLPGAVVLLDAQGRGTFANRAAEALLRRADLVVSRAGRQDGAMQLRLHSALGAQERAFQALLARALRPLRETDDEAEHFSAAQVLVRADGRPACVVHAAPLESGCSFDATGRQARAIVFLYDLDSATRVRPQLLCELFGMTLAEARAAQQVLRGGSVQEMAARLGISVNTFKTQLRLAYEKSHTHRQADLLKLLLSLASR